MPGAGEPLTTRLRTIYSLDKIHAMRTAVLGVLIAISLAACSERNLLGEELWTGEKLSRTEVSFGWNFQTANAESAPRYVDVLIKPDNSYEIAVGEYRFDAAPDMIVGTRGTLSPTVASRLRRQLAQLRSNEGGDLFATLPDCPILDHPAIEYYVGFKVTEMPAVTIIERDCKSLKTVEARQIMGTALAAFPQIDRANLIAGSNELS